MKKSESKYFNTAVRMDQAFLELLEKKDLNISEIAEMTGFCTVSYYITAFKRKTGDTPLEYRKKRSISALSQNVLPGTERTVTLTK